MDRTLIKAMRYISYTYLIIIICACTNSNKNNSESELGTKKIIKSDTSISENNQSLNNNSKNKYESYKSLEDSLTNVSTTYSTPKEMELEYLLNIQSRKDDVVGDWGIAHDNIYPIGWSKDGKFAYAMDNEWGGECGVLCYGLSIYILDLYNNKHDTIFGFHIDGEDSPTLKRDDINSMWNKKTYTIAKVLSDYKIEQFESFEFDTSKENIEKLTNYTTSDHLHIFEEGICGIIKNPFNKTEAIIRYEFAQGWEASPPDNLYYYVFSDSLNK